jgi:class 3 adenylate cyclase/tetratricopeptide (TPR) repeat protein
VICPSCGERNPEGARFCLNCGVPLVPPARREEERKVVTVLFCDLVGFTERSDRADPEDVKATLRPYHAAIKRTAEGFGGTLDAFVGDGALVVFGAPSSHEDDAERAIHVALRVQREIQTLNQAAVGPPLAVRIGIDTGEAIVGVGRGPQLGERVTGEVVGSATRLQSLAPVGGIAVGDATVRATRGRFEFERLDERGDAIHAWRPVEFSRLVRERPETPFVGREAESAVLRTVYRRVAAERSVRLVTIVAEAGVGKTRLVQEFAEYLDEEPDLIRWREGRCLPYGEGIGLWPLTEMVKAEAGILESDAPEETRGKLARSLVPLQDEPADRDWLFARLAPLVGLGDPSAQVDRAESFTAWQHYFESLAAQHTLVMVFEDLHWADDALLDFIEALVAGRRGLPIMVIALARPGLLERRPALVSKLGTPLPLPPLSDTETAILLSSLLDRAVLPAQTQAALLERAGGNPLYAEEFVRMLVDRGVLDPARPAALPEGAEIPIPESVHAIIGARIDALPGETKAILQDASVVGRVFWEGALAGMGDRDAADAAGRLDDLARLELIRPIATSSVAGDHEHAFWHMLVRDVAYGQIPRAERAAKHRAAGAWIESLSAEGLEDLAEVVAYHYGQALELAEDDDPELRARTVRAFEAAGRHAFPLNAAAAERLFRRGLGFLPDDDAARGRLLVRLADVETSLARFAEARDDFDAAIASLEASGDALGLGEALALKARALQRPGDTREANELLRRAIQILEREPPGPELARAYARMSGDALIGSRFAECREAAEKALALAQAFGMQEEIVRSRQYLGAARCELGDADGVADLWEAVKLGLAAGIGVETAVAYSNLAVQLWVLDGPGAALEVWEAAAEFTRARGFRQEELWARAGLCEVGYDLGRWDEVVATAEGIGEADPEAGGGQLRAFADVYRANVLARRGRLDEAVLLMEEFIPRVRILRRTEFLAPALAVAAVLEQLRGHHKTAAELVDEFGRVTDGQLNYRLLFLPDAVRVLIACGQPDRASELVLDEGWPECERHRLAISTARAAIAASTGGLEEAAERYEGCVAGWARYGSAFERAQALLGLARALEWLGRPGSGEAFDRAREAFRTLGAAPWLGEIDAIGDARAAVT